jgi:carbon monoxide dehydrogenase subunit G
MREFSTTIDIAAPPARVWDVMTDVERWHEWTASITGIQRFDEGPLKVGSRTLVKQPKLLPARFEVTVLEEGRGFDWRTRSAGVTAVGRHWIQPTAGGCRVTLGVAYGGPLGALIAWAYADLTRRYLAMEAKGLKRRSESG